MKKKRYYVLTILFAIYLVIGTNNRAQLPNDTYNLILSNLVHDAEQSLSSLPPSHYRTNNFFDLDNTERDQFFECIATIRRFPSLNRFFYNTFYETSIILYHKIIATFFGPQPDLLARDEFYETTLLHTLFCYIQYCSPKEQSAALITFIRKELSKNNSYYTPVKIQCIQPFILFFLTDILSFCLNCIINKKGDAHYRNGAFYTQKQYRCSTIFNMLFSNSSYNNDQYIQSYEIIVPFLSYIFRKNMLFIYTKNDTTSFPFLLPEYIEIPLLDAYTFYFSLEKENTKQCTLLQKKLIDYFAQYGISITIPYAEALSHTKHSYFKNGRPMIECSFHVSSTIWHLGSETLFTGIKKTIPSSCIYSEVNVILPNRNHYVLTFDRYIWDQLSIFLQNEHISYSSTTHRYIPLALEIVAYYYQSLKNGSDLKNKYDIYITEWLKDAFKNSLQGNDAHLLTLSYFFKRVFLLASMENRSVGAYSFCFVHALPAEKISELQKRYIAVGVPFFQKENTKEGNMRIECSINNTITLLGANLPLHTSQSNTQLPLSLFNNLFTKICIGISSSIGVLLLFIHTYQSYFKKRSMLASAVSFNLDPQ